MEPVYVAQVPQYFDPWALTRLDLTYQLLGLDAIKLDPLQTKR